MGSLRVAATSDPVRAARDTALHVVADAMFYAKDRGRGYTGAQVDALEAAAPYSLATEARRVQLAEHVRREGLCRDDADPETFFRPYSDVTSDTGALAKDRTEATALCDGCPVLGACLARDYHEAGYRVGNIHGVAAGLGARDRRALLPLWKELTARLTQAAEQKTAGNNTADTSDGAAAQGAAVLVITAAAS